MDNFFSERKEVRKNPSATFNSGLPELNTATEKPSKSTRVSDVEAHEELEDVKIEGESSQAHPKVQLLMEDGKVSRILITCTCGKCTELECNY